MAAKARQSQTTKLKWICLYCWVTAMLNKALCTYGGLSVQRSLIVFAIENWLQLNPRDLECDESPSNAIFLLIKLELPWPFFLSLVFLLSVPAAGLWQGTRGSSLCSWSSQPWKEQRSVWKVLGRFRHGGQQGTTRPERLAAGAMWRAKERAVRAEATAVQRLHGGSVPGMHEELDEGQWGKRRVWEGLERWAEAIRRTWQVSKESKGDQQ